MERYNMFDERLCHGVVGVHNGEILRCKLEEVLRQVISNDFAHGCLIAHLICRDRAIRDVCYQFADYLIAQTEKRIRNEWSACEAEKEEPHVGGL